MTSAAPLAFHNGRLVSENELVLSFADAGFAFGATVTDFCRTYRHRLFRWPDHLARLRHDCAALGIPLPYTDAELTAAAEAVAADRAARIAPSDDLAAVAFATPGPLGRLLGRPDNGPSTVGMHSFPLDRGRYRRFFTDGVVLSLAGVHSCGESDIVPAGVKHRSRLHWWLAQRNVAEPGAVPALTDANGGAADTAIGTVLAVFDELVVRPPRGTVLDGVSASVIEELCRKRGLQFAEATLDYRALPAGATELLLTGSAFGIAGVRTLLGSTSPREFPWPGPVFRRLLAAWNETVGMDIEAQMIG